MSYFAGCTQLKYSSIGNIHHSTLQHNRKVYDTVIFFDEVSMLILRLEMLKNVVDGHIIVEAKKTFTGKPKPLYFEDNKELFVSYESRITHVVIDDYAEGLTNTVGDVWRNEYYSRDAALLGLQLIGANDWDIVLISDTDEIPHPIAIMNLRLLFQYTEFASKNYFDNKRWFRKTGNIYKLFVDHYTYNFDCFVGGKELSGTPLTATTLGFAKILSLHHNNNRY